MIVGDGTTDPVAESGATLRTSIGVGTGDSPQFTGIELSHATANTLTASSGVLSIEDNVVYSAGGTDVPLADGGTGASLSDPGADRILFWDDGAGAVAFLTASTNLTICGTNITAAGGPCQASQSAIECETNEDTYVPPDLIKHSPGVAKVWVLWEQSGAHDMTGSYNMTSVTDGGAVGDTDHLWAVDFSGTTLQALIGQGDGASERVAHVNGTIAAGGVTTITSCSTTGNGADRTENSFVVFGDQ